jgi:methyl-accepting chemotaxis protein
MAHGDLSKDADAKFRARGDEIGTLTLSLQTMTVSLRKMMREIPEGIQVLASSSAELMSGKFARQKEQLVAQSLEC